MTKIKIGEKIEQRYDKNRGCREKIKQRYDKEQGCQEKIKQRYDRNQGYQEKIKHTYNKIKVDKKNIFKLNKAYNKNQGCVAKKSRLLREKF